MIKLESEKVSPIVVFSLYVTSVLTGIMCSSATSFYSVIAYKLRKIGFKKFWIKLIWIWLKLEVYIIYIPKKKVYIIYISHFHVVTNYTCLFKRYQRYINYNILKNSKYNINSYIFGLNM